MRTVNDFVHKGNSWGGKFELDKSRCAFPVHETGRGFHVYQCQKGIKETIDDFGFCTVHAKEVKRKLGIVAEIASVRFAAKFEDGEPTLLRLSVVSETESMIDIQKIEEVIGDSMMGFMNGNQRKNSTYTKQFRLFDDKNKAIEWLLGKSNDHIRSCENELSKANETQNKLLKDWYAK